jgi:hypothetical protein
MKRLVLFFLCYPACLHGQWCIDFEDGSLLNWNQLRDSTWQIQSDESLSGLYSLHHSLDDSVGNHDQIALPLDSLVLDASLTSWRFRIRHGYHPSSANHWAVFLASDGSELKMFPAGGINAYILGVNFTGSDDTLKLWKMKEDHIEILVRTSLNWQVSIGQGQGYLNVLRKENGIWQVMLGKGATGEWELIGEGLDTTIISPDYFGIYYRYSSKQDRKLWFDDLCISGLFMPDTLPPSIASGEVIDQNTIQLTFTEPVNESGCMIPGNFLLNPVGAIPDSLIMVSEKTCRLVFTDPFPGELPLTLIIYNMEDKKENSADSLKIDFMYYAPVPNDIVFNEIMTDPSPAIGLPEFEYLELYNRSPYPVNLGGWTYSTGNKAYLFPHFLIPGGKYLVLGYEGTADQYGSAGLFLGLLTSRTSLPNDGALLYLSDRDNILIDWVEYDPSMHDNDYYANGGWALERLDPDRQCMNRDNWATSISRSGGTPGQENSVKRDNPDRLPPSVVNLYLPDSSTLAIEFSEGMDPGSLLEPLNYLIDRGHGYPEYIECFAPVNRTAILHFDHGFDPGKHYQLKISGNLVDCTGLSVSSDRIQRFALPVQPVINEIMISEILFDPQPYCPRFIEIHNPGVKTFDLADMRIGKQNNASGQIESVSPVTGEHHLFFPGDYLALTEDPDKLTGCCHVHDPETLISCKGLPAMDESQGTMMILDKYLQVLDEMSYNKQMHNPLLSSTEGVSLERISFNLTSDHASNWHSAASTEGYSTPGRINSQNLQTATGNEGIEIEPEIFTPDHDGHHDLVMIKYDFPHPGAMATILVMDPRGRIIKRIAENHLLGSEGFFTWDGSNDHGQRARAGIYLVYARIFDAKGKVRNYKKTCVLSPGNLH